MSVKDEISKNLMFYRKKCGLTQKQFAEKLGVTNTAVSNWENGVNSIDIETLYRACDILGVSLDEVYGKTSNAAISTEDQELLDYLDELKNRSEMRMLFSLAKGATKKDVEQAVAIIEALRKNENG